MAAVDLDEAGIGIEFGLINSFFPGVFDFTKIPTKKPLIYSGFLIRGGEGSRTPVQTSSPKAFYMLIPALIVGKQQEPDTPIVSLAGWS